MASVYAFGVGFDSKSVDMYSRRKGVIVHRHNVIYNFFGAYLLKTPFPLVVLSIDICHVVFLISKSAFQMKLLGHLVAAFLERKNVLLVVEQKSYRYYTEAACRTLGFVFYLCLELLSPTYFCTPGI